MTRKTLFIFAAAALVAVLVILFARSGFPPASEDVVGTIGAAGDPPENEGKIAGVERAERYRSEQIAEGDVTLDESEVQMLLQDDEVLEIVQNPEFQRMMRDENLRRALMERSFQESLARNAMLRTAFAERSVALQREEVARLFEETPLARTLMRNAELMAAFERNAALARAVATDAELARALSESAELQRFFLMRSFSELLGRSEMLALTAQPAFARVTQPELLRSFDDVSFQRSFFERASSLSEETF